MCDVTTYVISIVCSLKVAMYFAATMNHLQGKFMGTFAILISDILNRLLMLDKPEVVHKGRESNFEF